MKKLIILVLGILFLILISPSILKPLILRSPNQSDVIAASVEASGENEVNDDQVGRNQAQAPEGNVIYKDKVVALSFHYLDIKEIPGVGISPERFISDLDMLQAKGYNTISLEQLRQFLKGEVIPNNAVLITFDDGYESNYKYALPELKKRNMPAVNFAIISYTNEKIGALQYLTWNEMKEMNAAGFITQSHTYDMHKNGLLANGSTGPVLSGPLKNQNKDTFSASVFQDLERSKDLTESNLQQNVYALALPWGVASNDAIQAATRAGMELIFTGRAGVITRNSNPQSLPRIVAGEPRISASGLDAWIRKIAGE